MTILTIKINEQTKAGKAFIAMAESFLKDTEGIEIIETKTTKLDKELNLMEQIELGFEQVKMQKEGKLKRKTLDDLLNEK